MNVTHKVFCLYLSFLFCFCFFLVDLEVTKTPLDDGFSRVVL